MKFFAIVGIAAVTAVLFGIFGGWIILIIGGAAIGIAIKS